MIPNFSRKQNARNRCVAVVTRWRHHNSFVVLLSILLLATLMTYVVESGRYQRQGRVVVPGTYQALEEDGSPLGLFTVNETTDIESPEGKAQAVSYPPTTSV